MHSLRKVLITRSHLPFCEGWPGAVRLAYVRVPTSAICSSSTCCPCPAAVPAHRRHCQAPRANGQPSRNGPGLRPTWPRGHGGLSPAAWSSCSLASILLSGGDAHLPDQPRQSGRNTVTSDTLRHERSVGEQLLAPRDDEGMLLLCRWPILRDSSRALQDHEAVGRPLPARLRALDATDERPLATAPTTSSCSASDTCWPSCASTSSGITTLPGRI